MRTLIRVEDGTSSLKRGGASAAIRTASQSFPASAAGHLGTGPQRAYAVLSGLGATALDCEPAAMARLAAGQVQVDPDLGSRGPGSLGLEVAWRKLPAPACPRPFPSSVGIDGV